MTDLHEVFVAADYDVELDDRRITLKIGGAVPNDLADWIAGLNGAVPAWLITAHNPGGRRLSPAANTARADVLCTLIDRAGLHRLPSVNRDPDRAWPDEPGWLVAGLEEGRMRDLARRFDQAAVVAVTGETATLLWL